MREELQHYDDLQKNPDLAENVEEDTSLEHTRLGTVQKAITLAEFQAMYEKDPALSNITANKLKAWLRSRLEADHLPSHQLPIEIHNNMVGSDFAYSAHGLLTQLSPRSLSIDFSKSTFLQRWTGEL